MLDGEYVISAGTDGWIKWWNLADIDAAEADENVGVPSIS